MSQLDLQSLPVSWYAPDDEESESLMLEFTRELPQCHELAGVQVSLIAHDGVDDILLWHKQEHDLVSVVHLTWLGREELPNHPTVEFSGTFAGFQAWYNGLIQATSASPANTTE